MRVRRVVSWCGAWVVLGCAAPRPVTQPQPLATGPVRFAVDTHLHLTMSQAAKPVFVGEPGDGVLTRSTRTRLVNQIDEAQLRAAGVGLVYGGLWPPFRARPRRTALDEALQQLRELDDFLGRRPGFVLALTAEDVRAAQARGRIAVMPQLEGGEGIESVDDVDALYAAGMRCLTVVHFVSTQLGGAAKGQLGKNLLGGKPQGALNPDGLSPLGRQVVERLMQLGVVIDLSHASDALVRDTLALTEPMGVPVIVSHTGARALTNWERALSDELARRVAASGGLIGLSLFDGQVEVDPQHEVPPSHQRGTCDDVVAHWKHFAQVVPPEALVLGSDLNGFVVRPQAGGACADGLRNTGDLNSLWAALVQAGVPKAALDGMGDALLRVVEKVESRADASAQAEALRRFRRVKDERSVLPGVP